MKYCWHHMTVSSNPCGQFHNNYTAHSNSQPCQDETTAVFCLDATQIKQHARDELEHFPEKRIIKNESQTPAMLAWFSAPGQLSVCVCVFQTQTWADKLLQKETIVFTVSSVHSGGSEKGTSKCASGVNLKQSPWLVSVFGGTDFFFNCFSMKRFPTSSLVSVTH